MGHIFISYSRKDEEYVNKLVVALENEGFEVWIDRELLTGDTWIQVINHKIDTCDAFVIVMTDAAKDSTWVRREVLYAIQEGKKIFPLLLQGKLWMYLQDFNFFKVVNESIPDRKFFRDIEKTVSRSEAWLAGQREASEKARLEIEEQERQIAAKEKAERETAEREKAELVSIEKAAREKEEIEKENKRRLEKSIKKAKRDYQWGKLKIDVRDRFQVIYIYRVPILISLVAIAFVTPLLIRLSNLIPEIITTLNNTPTATVSLTLAPQSRTNSTETFVPLGILTPSPASTEVLVVRPTSLPTEITDAKSVSMALVPSGEFTIGSDEGSSDEKPENIVMLDAFYMDIYEVTNALYRACMDSGVCAQPGYWGSYSRSGSYFWEPQYQNYPVIYVDWSQANEFCKWRTARLPTEAEWEKAARGADKRLYPWGEGIDRNFANYGFNIGDTSEMGKYENGKSPYGMYDMAGNVWEWVSSLYKDYPYDPNDGREDLTTSGLRVIRGGSWNNQDIYLRSYARTGETPSGRNYNLGFRCAKDAP